MFPRSVISLYYAGFPHSYGGNESHHRPEHGTGQNIAFSPGLEARCRGSGNAMPLPVVSTKIVWLPRARAPLPGTQETTKHGGLALIEIKISP